MSNQLAVYSDPRDLKKFLDSARNTIKAALPKHLSEERMIRLALTAFSTTPELRECTGQSILASLIIASQMGLEPGIRGQGYLIPYKRTCTFVPGWQGLVGLLNNSGRATAWTGAVFDGDTFDIEYGSHPRLVHVPSGPNQGDPAKITWVYACGQVNGAQHPVIEAWTMPRVMKHRDKFNKVGPKHYSFKHPEMYGRKVVLLQVLKYMPSSIELSNAINLAEANEMNRSTRVEDNTVIIEAENSDIEQARVGQGSTPAGDTAEETVSERAAREESETQVLEPKPVGGGAGPKAAELLKTIKQKASVHNIGARKLTETAIALEWMKENEKLDELDSSRLADFLSDIDTLIAKALNPG